MRTTVLLIAVAALVATLPASGAQPVRRDLAALARTVLPPGQDGGVSFTKHSTDQIPLYDGLTPLFDRVGARDVRRYFKDARLWRGTERAVRVERPKQGVRILRDGFGVPHIFAATETDLMFGLGWATAADRGVLMELARGPGRLAAIDPPGLDAFALALSGRQFLPSAQTEAALAAQVRWLRAGGAAGRGLLAGIDAFVAGINAYRRAQGLPLAPWRRNDVIAMAALLGQRFGAGGGGEATRALFRDALEREFGAPAARSLWNDLRLQLDPETPVTAPGRFAYAPSSATGSGNAVLDDGSLTPVRPGAQAATFHRQMSNAILVGAARSATGRPLMVAGPQLGFFYPEFFMEADLHGGSFDVRGGLLPGIPLVLIGRGPDFAWSATSATSDNIDTYVETLCGGDDIHYLFRGQCREMGRFDAGTLRAPGRPDERVAFLTTVHGPVFAHATVDGRRVALSLKRSTRGRELRSALALYRLNTAGVRSARDFVGAVSRVEFAFNFFYVDDRDVAMYSAGRLPLRPASVDPGLPTVGTGEHEWRGFLAARGHPQAISPPGGTIVNWNNKPSAAFGSADDQWTYGPVHRVTLLSDALERGKLTIADAVAAMNKAATQDIRAVELVPVIAAALGGPDAAPSPRARRMLELLEAWSRNGGSRLDRDLDGWIDDPGAAVMDAAWPRLAEAVMRPALGALTERLAAIEPRFSLSMAGSWLNYVHKDLRALLGQPVRGPLANRYCGRGNLAACRASLWAAIEEAGAELAAAQGAHPAAWRSDATRERIRFAPGILPNTMRGANRPTFQQLMSFRSHRGR